jgi:CHRD domain
MNSAASIIRTGETGARRLGTWLRMPGRPRLRTSAAGAATAALGAAAVVTLVAAAGAHATGSGGAGAAGAGGHGAATSRAAANVVHLVLQPMPVGAARLGHASHGRLVVHLAVYGLTPGSSHNVDLVQPGGRRLVRFSTLSANGVGQADKTLSSSFRRRVPPGSRLVIRMGTGGSRVAGLPIAETRRLAGADTWRTQRLRAVEVSSRGVDWGTPRGRATIVYNPTHQTLTVTVSASGVTPGPHAAHIHLGSCQSQGPVKYMLRDLVANRNGRIVHAVRVFTHVTAPIPASGWYLNIHQGNSGDILSNGQPTIYFRPLICANIRGSGGSYSSILQAGDVVTGVRGTSGGQVVLSGTVFPSSGTATKSFLYQGRLSTAGGKAVSTLTPSFPAVTSAAFYGPDTHAANPSTIPPGKVRAVGSYESSSGPAGVINQGMIYLGPVSGQGGSWTSINVPANGRHTNDGRRACPRSRPRCVVMDTIPHSTMGNLVVGNYDLKPAVRGGPITANAFIYNMTTRRWTLLVLHGSQSTQSTFYGIWQDGGPGSWKYTLAGGSAASGHKTAFLIGYNERTGKFGRAHYYRFGNGRAAVTHFEGITSVPGGFHLVAMSTAQIASMAFVPFDPRTGRLGAARWYPVETGSSSLCSGGCSAVTGNTVYQNHVMGLYQPKSATLPGTYLATIVR